MLIVGVSKTGEVWKVAKTNIPINQIKRNTNGTKMGIWSSGMILA
jgi:hypothetical protein